MANDPGILTYFRNYSSSDTTSYTDSSSISHPLLSVYDIGWTIPSGYAFKEWNRFRDGSGTSYQPGGAYTGSELFAIWEPIPVPYLVTNVELTDVADAIRTKGGTSAALEWPTDYVDAIDAIETGGGGGDGSFKAIIEGTATSPTLPSDLTAIRNYAFYYLSSLSSVDIPSGVTSIGDYAFYRCSNLETASLPSALTSIGDNAFYYCSKFDVSSLPNSLQTIGSYAFYRCSELSISSLPANLKTIGTYAFDSCSKITITSVPSGVTKIENYSFQECDGITQMSLPSTVTLLYNGAFYGCDRMGTFTASGALTTIGSQAFRNCYNLTDARFPNASISSFPSNAFMSCGKLAIVDIGNTSSIPASAFANCYKLQTLVIRKTGSICTLANVSAFNNTPMRGYKSLTGTVYVPNALISTYQTATNWKTLYDAGTVTFTAIEGSAFEL